MENILSVKGIKKSFGGVHALKGVDLTIRKGETHCLAGENGCGKSTIIKVISGFYKPDGGTIEVDGRDYPVMTPGGRDQSRRSGDLSGLLYFPESDSNRESGI